MNIFTAGKNQKSLKITAAFAMLAGAAALSGCAGDPYYGNASYSQTYSQPGYNSSPYYGPTAGYAPAYDPYYSSSGYYPTYSDSYYPSYGYSYYGGGRGYYGGRSRY